MAREVKRRRGTTAQHAAFTGALGELTIDTDKKVAVVHDGSTAGGFPMAREEIAELFKRLPESAYTDNHTLSLADAGVMHIFNKATAVTASLPAVAGTDGEVLFVRNINDGTLTIDPNSSEEIEGDSTMELENGFGAMIWPNAGKTAWRAMVFRNAPGGDAGTADGISFDNEEAMLPDDPDTVQEAIEKVTELATAPSISFRAFKGSNQTAGASGSYIIVTCGTENWDEGSYYNTSTGRWTPPAGRYSCYGNALLTSGIEDGMLIAGALLKNGTMVAEYNGRAKGTDQQSVPLPPTDVEVDGDDYLEFAVVLGGAGDKTIFAGTGYTYWGGHKI